MANVKISDLTAITSSSDLADADIVPIIDNSDLSTKKVALSVLNDFWSEAGNWCTGTNIVYLLTDCVGIGTATPGTDIMLRVQGDSCYTGDLKIGGDVCIGGNDLFMSTNTSGYMLIADGTNFNPVAMSGDVGIDSAGATTIQATSVENSMLAGSIANAKLSNSSVSYGGVSLSLGGTDATPAFNLCDATAYKTSNLAGTITNAQLAGSIANDKLSNDSVSYGGVSVDLGATDATPAFNLCDATAYKGDSALVTVGTIASGTWQGTAIANGYLASSSITLSDGSNTTAISLGGTMTFSGTSNEIEVAESSGTVTIGLPSVITGLTTVCATNLAGTLATAAQTNVTSLGTLTALTVDSICLNGTTIGHTSDTDLMTLADGVLTVSGRLDAADDVKTDSIRRYSDSSTTTKILLNDEVIKINAGHASNEVVKIASGAVTIDGDLTICGDDLVMGTNTSGYLLVADGTNYNPVAMSGDVAIASNGATTIQATSVDNSMLAGSIANDKLSNSSVSYGGVSLSLGGTDATPAFNLCDATAYKGDSGLVTSGALNSGSITSGFGNIDNGSSTITTTGALAAGALTATGNISFDGGTFVFNESGADKDFRIEGDTDANLFFVDASTDRIGIGTATPATELHVEGDVTIGNQDKLYFDGGVHTFVCETSGGTLVFDVAGTSVMCMNDGGAMRVNSCLKVGQNNTGADAYFAADASLKAMNWCANGVGTDGALILTDNTRLALGTGCDAEMRYDGTNMYINPRSVGTGNLIIGGAATCFLIYGATSKVGIGTSTPTCTLEVWMCCAAHCSNIILTNDCSTGHQSAIEFCNGYGSGFSNARIAGGVEDTGDGYIKFQVGLASTLTDVGYWDSDGNLGIGTNSPTQKLHVQGNACFTGVVDVGGNVGIGTATPATELHVQGDIMIPGNASSKLYFSADKDTYIHEIGGGTLVFEVADVSVMCMSDVGLVRVNSCLKVGQNSTGADAYFAADASLKAMTWCANGVGTAGALILADNTRLALGTGCDAELRHDGTDMYINPRAVGSGNLIISGAATCLMLDGASSKVGIGTTAPYLKTHIYDGSAGTAPSYNTSADQFVIENNGNVNMYLLSAADATSGYHWSVAETRSKAGVSVDHTTCLMTFTSGGGSFSQCAYQLMLHNGGSQTVAPADKVSLGSTDKTGGNTQLTVNTEGTGAVAVGTSTAALAATMAIKINGTQYYVMLSTAAAT